MRQLITLLSLLTACSITFAHGEDELGPHNGYVRMSGAFHAEVIPEKNDFKIMLLDINFENPTVENSSVKAVIIGKDKKRTELSCSSKADYFVCPVTKAQLKQTDTLELIPTRQGTTGPAVSYPLPLHLELAKNIDKA